MDIVLIGSIAPISASLHCSECPVVLHITCSVSPALHTRALGEGDRVTAAIIIIMDEGAKMSEVPSFMSYHL